MCPMVHRMQCDEKWKKFKKKWQTSYIKKEEEVKWSLRGQTMTLLFPAGLPISFGFLLNFLCLSHQTLFHSIPSITTNMRSTFLKNLTHALFLLPQTNIFQIYHHYV